MVIRGVQRGRGLPHRMEEDGEGSGGRGDDLLLQEFILAIDKRERDRERERERVDEKG